MPELPEVEVLRRHLEGVLPGRRIAGLEVLKPRSVRPDTAATLRRRLVGARFRSVERRAKYLVFVLVSPDRKEVRVLGHLGMTGRMYVAPASAPLPPHAAVVAPLDRGRDRLVFEDVRGFGRLTADLSALDGLGPEPLSLAFNDAGFSEAVRGTRRTVKTVLMDQSVVAGVGNIYASEALFRAGIRPDRPAGSLGAGEVSRLVAAVRDVLGEAVAFGASAPLDFAGGGDGLFYYGSDGVDASVAERFKVYGRGGQPCPHCGSPVRRAVMGGRSTFWCDRCQR